GKRPWWPQKRIPCSRIRSMAACPTALPRTSLLEANGRLGPLLAQPLGGRPVLGPRLGGLGRGRGHGLGSRLGLGLGRLLLGHLACLHELMEELLVDGL